MSPHIRAAHRHTHTGRARTQARMCVCSQVRGVVRCWCSAAGRYNERRRRQSYARIACDAVRCAHAFNRNVHGYGRAINFNTRSVQQTHSHIFSVCAVWCEVRVGVPFRDVAVAAAAAETVAKSFSFNVVAIIFMCIFIYACSPNICVCVSSRTIFPINVN